MDCIVFDNPHESLYRPSGQHEFKVGECRVQRIVKVRDVFEVPSRPAAISNLCGRFLCSVNLEHLESVAVRYSMHFGRHRKIHHLWGTVSVHMGVAQFKGCPSFSALCEIARDIGLESSVCQVYMGVFTATLGRFVDTNTGGYIENRVVERFASVSVCVRLMDQDPAVVKFYIRKFDRKEMPFFTDECVPLSADVKVSMHGVMLLRISWPRIKWNEAIEAQALEFSAWLANEFRGCC